MNERIKELDKQAKLWAMDNTNFPISSHIPAGYIEKFAELIVKECANFVENIFDDDGGHALCEDYAKGIKQHFGVE